LHSILKLKSKQISHCWNSSKIQSKHQYIHDRSISWLGRSDSF